MKNLARGILIVLVFSGLTVTFTARFLTSCQPSQHPHNDRASVVNQLPQTDDLHPYGRPAYGSLMWENDEDFQELLAKYEVSMRMAAFQTTLPDPLPGEEYNVARAADLLAGTVVNPGEIFSMNTAIGPYTKERGFREGPTYMGNQVVKTIGGGVCKVSTTLYNVAILANLKIIERHCHGMMVPYVPPGQDATVSYGNRDFKFQNNTEHPIIIWADTKGNTLYIAFYGRSRPPKVKWHHKILHRQEMPVIYRNNTKLQPGEEKVIIPGADGLTVKSWLTIEYSDSKTVTKELGIDYYRPMTQVVERGPQ
ncbi:MAG: VanW family protein [Peptococcaceae bacterium]|nr:VanW family protein [Peptococcaceae bacterium]